LKKRVSILEQCILFKKHEGEDKANVQTVTVKSSSQICTGDGVLNVSGVSNHLPHLEDESSLITDAISHEELIKIVSGYQPNDSSTVIKILSMKLLWRN
jgi:hypothetical protein